MSQVLSRPISRMRDSDARSIEQYLILEDVGWELYESVLKSVGDNAIRVTFDRGRIEIISPRWEHENIARLLGRLVEMLTLELDMQIASGGSVTLRDKSKQRGTEPDQCYFFKNASKMRGKKGAWISGIDPAPDLVIEIDITSPSIDREPIYASIGVPEIWRWDGKRLMCLHLKNGKYIPAKFSASFKDLEVARLKRFVDQLRIKDENAIVRGFLEWMRKSL